MSQESRVSAAAVRGRCIARLDESRPSAVPRRIQPCLSYGGLSWAETTMIAAATIEQIA